MGRPGPRQADLFTSREVALASGISVRNFALLVDEALAPTSLVDGPGRTGHRLYDAPALAEAALVGALHLAGLELLVAARLGEAFANEYAMNYGRLPSNLGAFLQAPLNPNPKQRPWQDDPDEAPIDLAQDFWLHQRLRNRSTIYQSATALRGDFIIDIADHAYVTTEHRGLEIPVFSPASGGLPASPDFRIVGRGAAARVLALHEELESLNVFHDPAAAARMKSLETDYMEGRDNAVSRLRINLSLAIRNAFDRLQDDRDARAA